MDGLQPTTIVDKPIPLLTGNFIAASGNNSDPGTSGANVAMPTTQVDVAFPPVSVAVETISQSLNTETKRILGEYTFEQLGAIVVGLFSQGVSGDIKISPDGIVATNINGDTTFALDGATGDATFLGTLIAGSIITGAINVGANNVIIDGANKRIVINDGTTNRIIMGYLSGGF